MDAPPRTPAVAGRFYPGDAATLAREVERLSPPLERAPVIAVVGPHAGYVYSGALLAETYARVRVPPRVLLMGPNHTGQGIRRSLWGGGAWSFPGFDVAIDEPLRDALEERSDLSRDCDAHGREHSLEVHVPFLRRAQPALRLTPVCLAGLSFEDCCRLGLQIAAVVAEERTAGRDVLIAASTDMTHFLSATEARAQDMRALKHALDLDAEGLHRTVRSEGISMCGVVPTTVAIVAARELGATEASLVRYANSGDVSGDMSRVVGYAGFVLT